MRLGRPAAQSPTLPDRQHIHSDASRPKSHVYIQQPQRPTRQSPNAFFAASVSKTRKHEVHIFSASKTIASGLTGQYLPILFSYQSYNLQQDNSFHSGTSRPTPSCPTSLQNPMLPARQHIPFRRQPATTSRHHSFHTGPTILNQPTPSSQLGRPTPSTSSVLLPLLQPAGQTRNVVSRAGAACKAADGAGEEPAFLFFLFFYFFLLLSFLSPFPSPWRRGFAATPSFFFLLLFFFLFFSFCFFCFYFCFFLFAFFSLFFF